MVIDILNEKALAANSANRSGNELDKFVFETFVSKIPTYFFPKENERLWVHDFIHAILKIPGDGKGEETAAIYQSVLLREMNVNYAKKQLQDDGMHISLDGVKNLILPDILEYRKSLVQKFGLITTKDLKPRLTADEITAHYGKAKILSFLMKEHFGKDFSKLTLEEIKKPSLKDYEDIVEQTHCVFESISKKPCGVLLSR